jgi:hypothetical protein
MPFFADFLPAVSQISSHRLKDFPLLKKNLLRTFENELFSGLQLTNLGELKAGSFHVCEGCWIRTPDAALEKWLVNNIGNSLFIKDLK